MLTFPLGIRIVAIGAAATAFALIMLGNERSAGFGIVRESEPVRTPVVEADLAQRLTKLQAQLVIEPAQESAWNLFTGRMLDLDQASRRLEQEGNLGASAAEERARHALLFAVALSDIDGTLSSAQSAALQREARALGSTFVCAEGRQDGS